jgi:hypothetical protein
LKPPLMRCRSVQKKQLLEFVASRVNGGNGERCPTDLREFPGAARVLSLPPILLNLSRVNLRRENLAL